MGIFNGIVGYVSGQMQKITGGDIARATSFVAPASLVTIGAGSLTASLLVPGTLIRRTGPTGNYTDTIVTAAVLTAAFPEIEVGQSYTVTYSNRVAFTVTIAGDTGVTAVAGSNTTSVLNTSFRIVLTKVSATAWTFELIS